MARLENEKPKTRYFRRFLARDIREPLKVKKEPIESPKKDLLKVASRLVVTPDKPVFQGMGLSCNTGGNWSSREKKSKVLHLDNMACFPVPPV